MGSMQDERLVEFIGMVGTVIATTTLDVANDNYAEEFRLAA